MIDALDKKTQTLPFEPTKRGRGRPKTGKAMTPAEKQRAYRERQKAAGNVTENTDTHKTGSIELLRERALSRGRTCVAQARIIGELEKRIAELEAQLAKRPAVTEKPARVKRHRDQPAAELTDDDVQDEGVWTVQFKPKGRRTWVSCDPQIDFEGIPWGYKETRQHVLDMQIGTQGSVWRAVRDDGMIYDPKAAK